MLMLQARQIRAGACSGVVCSCEGLVCEGFVQGLLRLVAVALPGLYAGGV